MQMNIEEVYGASKYQQRVTQAPSSISIVTAEQIRRFGYRSLAEVLQGVRGMYVTNDSSYNYVGVRGFLRPGDANTRVLVLIDGHRFNGGNDSTIIGREAMLDPELIERVEVIRGPGSSMYGSNAFFGVINVITKRGGDFGGSQLAVDGGTHDTYKLRGTYAGSTATGTDWTLSATRYSSAGEGRIYYPEFDQRISDNPRAAHDGVASGRDGEDATKLFGSLRRGDFGASAYISDRTKQIPTGVFGSIFDDPSTATEDRRGYVDVQYQHAWSDALAVQLRGTYDWYSNRVDLPYDYALPGSPPNRVLSVVKVSSEWVGAEGQLTIRPNDRYTLVGGVDYGAKLNNQAQQCDDIEPRRCYIDINFPGPDAIVGLFAQAEVRLRNDLSVTAGVRHDHYHADIGSTTNPRLAVIFNPSAGSAIKALYGRAFRAPTIYERFTGPGQPDSQAGLEPEIVSTYELVYEQYFGSAHRVSLSGYSYDIDGLITQQALFRYENADDVRARGVEVEWEGTYENGTSLRSSLAVQRAKDVATGLELTNSPRRIAQLSASAPVVGGLIASLEVQYASDRLKLSRTRAGSFVVTNLAAHTPDLWHGVELTAGIYNLFDVDHPMVAAPGGNTQELLPQEGRTFSGRVTMRF